MISGIHLATALSVMLHMEQEGEMMETKDLIADLRDYTHYTHTNQGSDIYEHPAICDAAADRLSEQQQVIDELVEALEATTNAIAMQLGQLNANRIASNKDILSKAKGHTKDAD